MPSKFNIFCTKIVTESLRPVPAPLKKLISKYLDNLDIFMAYEPKTNTIELITLRAKKDAPKGTGSSFMNDLISWADANSSTIILQTAVKDDYKGSEYKVTTSMNRLKKFYSKFGFKYNYSPKSYHPEFRGNMHRLPKKI